MKKILSALTAALILGASAQALATGCEDGACELPQKQDQAYCIGSANAYCSGDTVQSTRSERRGTCGCYNGR
ncbi:MAG: hypothetical protein ACFNJM_09640 [Selenomonas artemidis]|jgi:iron-sulfur cluster-binding protein|uniref:hypothetical protein n=1 Tax=Selenomonas artemidis TaxID=671224 RepID=UPI00288B5DCF|nr:hypothetical protein [Selenomonas artemidis]